MTRVCALGFIFLLTSLNSTLAQSGSWSAAGMQDEKKKAKVKFEDMKKHAEQMGMDTSFKHCFFVGGKLNTDGWSGIMNLMKRKTGSTTNYWQLSFSEIKHEKQVKQKGKADAKFGNNLPYVFGKINNIYTLQLGFGKEKLLLPAVLNDNLSVSIRYNIGASLAMLKPYYLKLIYTATINGHDSSYLEEQSYSHDDSAAFLNKNRIYGGANWAQHFNQITYTPGAYIETAITITPGKAKAFVQKILLGGNISIYKGELPVMADQIASKWKVSLFAGLLIGKIWK